MTFRPQLWRYVGPTVRRPLHVPAVDQELAPDGDDTVTVADPTVADQFAADPSWEPADPTPEADDTADNGDPDDVQED